MAELSEFWTGAQEQRVIWPTEEIGAVQDTTTRHDCIPKAVPTLLAAAGPIPTLFSFIIKPVSSLISTSQLQQTSTIY